MDSAPTSAPPSTDFDLIVLGGGSAGYAGARTAAAAGLRTAVIEGAPQVGGLCILRGCMPSKALLWAAEVRHLARQGATWGLRPGPVSFDWTAVQARKDTLIREFASYREQQLRDGRFEFIQAQARFTDPHTVLLSDGRHLRARHFLIATGSVVAEPPLPELRDLHPLTSDDILALEHLPRSIIVLGGGAIALELAQVLHRFDVEVTLLQRSPHVLSGFDPDLAAELEAPLRKEGIHLITDTTLVGARLDGAQRVISFRQGDRLREVRAESVLLALGRSPNTRHLGLEHAGVKIHRGRIVADAHLRTSQPHIYAAGDCTGPHDVVHLAIQQAEFAVHNFLHPDRPRSINERLLLQIVFTDPQVAVVGLSETRARAASRPFRAENYRFDDHGKSLLMEARHGFVKLLADPVHGEILGGACVGPVAGELIHEIVAAMAKHMTVRELAAMPHYHPTLAEIWTYPAEALADALPPLPNVQENRPGGPVAAP